MDGHARPPPAGHTATWLLQPLTSINHWQD